MDIFSAKNCIRFLAGLVDFHVISPQPLASLFLSLLEIKPKYKTHTIDMILEVALVGFSISVILVSNISGKNH